jgi:membrane protease YdiL (CAAX protease family)
VEVATVVVLFVLISRLIRASEFGEWQQAVWGASFLSSSLLFFVLPLIPLFLAGRNVGRYGLASRDLKYHTGVGLKLGGILLPATVLFPVLALLNTDPMEWPGACLLAAGFAGVGFLALGAIAKRDSHEPEPMSASGLLFYAGFLLAGIAAGAAIHSFSELLARVLHVLVFVALLEEFFFRGYIQGRLNETFNRPYSLFQVRFGPGLIASALLFGLFHPIMSPLSTTPWPWALWTAVMGLVLGLVREKTGAVLATTIAHGMILLPMVFFGS